MQPSVRRLRASAGPLWTVGLALLLLGLLYTHGAGTGDAAAGHHGGAVAAQSASVQSVSASAHHVSGGHEGHEGHEERPDAAHQALECLSGQPQEDFVLDGPGPAPVPWTPCAYDGPGADPGLRAAAVGTGAGTAVATPGTAAVLRI
ncbi:hypothetical protein [Streptomyces albiaxialis]|uniref:hypothetical protein n=1 Tax=Streptomyces albiaxialis TaxID=329523 RepID=UPI0031D4A35A